MFPRKSSCYFCYWFYLWFSAAGGSNRWNWEINFLGQVLFPAHPLLQTWTRSTNKERQSAWKKYCSALFRKQAFVWTVVCAAKCFLRQKSLDLPWKRWRKLNSLKDLILGQVFIWSLLRRARDFSTQHQVSLFRQRMGIPGKILCSTLNSLLTAPL